MAKTSPYDRPLLAKLMMRAMSEGPEAGIALAKAKDLMREARVNWYDVIPGARVAVSARAEAPSFVEAVELTIDEAIQVVLINSRDEEHVKLARVLYTARERRATLAPHGIRMIHRYANQLRRRG